MPGRETGHASLSTDEVKKEWILNTSPICYLDVHRDNIHLLSFTLALFLPVLHALSVTVGLG
jgi:hypothetical protein